MLNLLSEVERVAPQPKAASGKGADVERRRMEAWLDERIHTALSEPMSEPVTLTPVLAGILLEPHRNPDNRPISELLVDRISSDIKGRRYIFNGEPIIISREGYTNDGQHRCHAVIKTGKAIRTMISFGFERESRMTLDQGNTRTAGHYLSMAGVVDGNGVGTVATMIWQYKEHNRLSTDGRSRPTKSQVLLVAESYKDIHDSLLVCGKTNGVAGRTLLAFCHWVASHKAGKAAADEFFSSLISGANLGARSPILYARNRLNNERLTTNEKVELIFRAWNAWREKRTVKSLPVNGGVLPKLER